MSDDEVPKHRATKNRRKWCRGKVGVEHVPACMDYAPGNPIFKGWKTLACTVCGKQLETWLPRLFGIGRPKPEWVR